MSEFSASVQIQVFPNDKRGNDKAPDHRGSFEMTPALLKEMVELVKKGETIHVEIALWDRVGRTSGKEYMFGKMSVDEWRVNRGRKQTDKQTTEEEDPFAY